MTEKYRSLEHSIRDVITETSFVSTRHAINAGHVKSGRDEYSSFAGGHTTAMDRVADQERDAKKEQQASKDEMNKEIRRRQQAAHEEVNPDKNSEERRKVVNVSRMDDEPPTSEKSKLGKTSSIKTKIIEEPTEMFTKNFGLSASLVDAVRNVMEADKADKVADEVADASKHNNAKTMVRGKPNVVDIHPKLDTTMKEELKGNQNKLDKAPPYGELTKADFTALRSKKCSKCGKTNCKCGSMKEEAEILDKGMRLIGTHVNGPHIAKVYNDTDWGEYRVKYFKNGKHLPTSDSHHDDSDDAHETAKYQIKNFREEVEFSEAELARLQEIEASFNSEVVDEATKKSTKVPSATTTISAPIKGANQDQSGVGVSRDVADYTISDETRRDSPEWQKASRETRVKIVQKEVGAIDKKITEEKFPEKKDNDIMSQLRRVISTQGRYPITHLDGRQTKITPQLAVHAMEKHIGMKNNEKQDFEHKLHKSQDSMRSTLS